MRCCRLEIVFELLHQHVADHAALVSLPCASSGYGFTFYIPNLAEQVNQQLGHYRVLEPRCTLAISRDGFNSCFNIDVEHRLLTAHRDEVGHFRRVRCNMPTGCLVMVACSHFWPS